MSLTNIWAIMLNNGAKKHSAQVLESLEIKQGDRIADIGSGGGYFIWEFAKRVGADGKVFAVDTDKALLSRIDKKKRKEIWNVETIVGKENSCGLPDNCCDLIFMRNVFHHINDPIAYFLKVRDSIKPGKRIVIIERIPGIKRSYFSHGGHSTPEEEIQRVMEKSGFQEVTSFNFLEDQTFSIFEKENGIK